MAVKKNEPTKTSFGKRLAKTRKAKGLTQEELGKKIGVSQRVIAYYEGETNRPPSNKLDRIAEILNVTTDELLGVRSIKTGIPIKNRRLVRSLRKLEQLPTQDQKAVVNYIDALSVKRNIKI